MKIKWKWKKNERLFEAMLSVVNKYVVTNWMNQFHSFRSIHFSRSYFFIDTTFDTCAVAMSRRVLQILEIQTNNQLAIKNDMKADLFVQVHSTVQFDSKNHWTEAWLVQNNDWIHWQNFKTGINRMNSNKFGLKHDECVLSPEHTLQLDIDSIDKQSIWAQVAMHKFYVAFAISVCARYRKCW